MLDKPVERDLSPYHGILEQIDSIGRGLETAQDATLRRRFHDPALDSVAAVFSLVREASRRTLALRPFDVQLLAGLVLHDGKLAEMKTGEGKTLAAVAPAALNALAGRGVHVLTFNDYLARRDAAWMGPIYELLGLRVGVTQEGMSIAERRQAYAADVTYATAKEAGFDFLRGFLCRDAQELVHRPFHYAIVDEADSVLIDEARVPLVIAGDLEHESARGPQMAGLVGELEAGVHFETDENERNVNLTQAGLDLVEQRLGRGDLLAPENLDCLTRTNCALHARVLLHRDVDYIVRNGKIELVDEFTGRVVDDRHLPDGLQAAVEAKEGVAQGSAGTILGSITLQHFLRSYPKLSGMTATAEPAADELLEFYDLEVVLIPPHRPSIRIDHADRVFTHLSAKNQALLEEIGRVHPTGRPILVGTASVEESETLARSLTARGISCEVLNAKRDELEARIVAEAGALGAVTISTNMAGRGTDIRLGGGDERDRDRVTALGGLYVIGTNRHESRRIDDQLRGRAGRQGDPGSSRFFVSLEDPLISRFGVVELIPTRFRPLPQSTALDDPLVRREIRRAQRIIEGQNLEIRRTLTYYSTFVEEQRWKLHERRQQQLLGKGAQSFLEAESSARYQNLLEAYGREVVAEVESQITLFHIDRIWREHLAHVSDLRESIHVVRVGGRDPLATFQQEIGEAFRGRREELDEAILRTFELVEVSSRGIDPEKEGLRSPSSTWTYLISDNPFRDQLYTRIAGDSGMALGLMAPWNLPIVFGWMLYRRLFGRRRP